MTKRTVRVSSQERLDALVAKARSMTTNEREPFIRNTVVEFPCLRCGKTSTKTLRAFVENSGLYCTKHLKQYNWIVENGSSWEDFDEGAYAAMLEGKRRASIIEKHGSWEEAERVPKERLAEFEVREYGSHEAFRKKRDVALRETVLNREKDPEKRAEKKRLLEKSDLRKEEHDESLVGKTVTCVECGDDFVSRGRNVCWSCLLKRTHLEKYGSIENFAKTMMTNLKKSMLKKYGYDNSMAVPEICAKAYDTKVALYGTANNNKKAKQTKLERYGDENYINKKKIRETTLKRYGCDHVWQSPEVRQKGKETCISRYGPESKDVSLKKRRTTKLERYGDENYTISKKAVITVLIRHVGMTEDAAVSLAISLSGSDPRYFVVRYLHIYKGIVFDSSWELAYYVYLSDISIDFTYKPSPVQYLGKNEKQRQYYPDFFVDGRYVEIKGNHLLKNGVILGRDGKPDVYKTKCCVDNDVQVISSTEMKVIFEYLRKNVPTFKASDYKITKLGKEAACDLKTSST